MIKVFLKKTKYFYKLERITFNKEYLLEREAGWKEIKKYKEKL